MAGFTQRVAISALVLNLLMASGCSSVQLAMHNMLRRGAATEELVEKKIEYRADLHEQRLAQKLAEIDDRLRKLNHTTCTQTETTLAMELSQSLEIQNITVDVEELKNVIARAEAQSRAEQLRRERLPGLLREQQEAFGPDGFGHVRAPHAFEQVAYDANLRPAANEADIVVGVDQHGHPLPFCNEQGPAIAPSEIPYIVRMRINVGLQDPRLEASKVRRHPGCGLPDCRGKECSKCASLIRSDQQYAVADAGPTEGFRGGYMRVAQGWPAGTGADQVRSAQNTPPAPDGVRVEVKPLAAYHPAVDWPGIRADRDAGSPSPDAYPSEFASPATDFRNEQATVNELRHLRSGNAMFAPLPPVVR